MSIPPSAPKPGGPTHQLTEDIAALIRSNDPHTAARLAVSRVTSHVESRLRLDYDAVWLALDTLVKSFASNPAVPQEQALAEAVEILEAVA